jgi:hypothetical protein
MLKNRFGWLLLAWVAAMLPLHAQTDASTALAKDGTPTAAVLNGFNTAVTSAQMDPGDINSTYTKYQETRGPLLAKFGFNINAFLGGKTPGNPSGLMALIRAGFFVALIVTFIAVAVGAVKGRASISDLGWAFGKTLLGILIFLQAGAIYALIMALPLLVGRIILVGTNAQPGGGVIKQMAANAVNDGTGAAQAYMAGTMQALASEQSANQVDGILAASKRLNDWMKATGAMQDSELVQIPQGNAANKAVPLTNDQVLRLLQDVHHATSLWVSRWPSWQFPAGSAPAQALKLLTISAWDDARGQLGDDAGNADKQAEDCNAVRTKVYRGLKAAFDQNVIDPLPCFQTSTSATVAPVVTPDGVMMPVAALTGPSSARVKQGGEIAAKRILDTTQQQSYHSITGFLLGLVSTQWMGGVLPLLCAAWMGLVELLMLQFTIFLPLWVHPKTEATVTKGLKALVMTACFLPVYMPCLMVVDRFLYFTLGSAGNVTGLLGMILMGPWVVMWLCLITIASPILAAIMAIKVLKHIVTGLSVVGGVLKGALTALGTVAVAATPVGRVAAIAGGAALGRSAAASDASAQAPGVSAAAAARHRAAARVKRGIARGLDVAQETAGKIFGVDEKYIDPSYTLGQNLRGAHAAQKAVGWAGMAAAFHGEGATGLVTRMQKQGEEYRKDVEGREGTKGASANEAIDAQRAAAEEMTRAVDRLTAAVEQAPRRPADLRSLPPAPTAAGGHHATRVPEETAAEPPVIAAMVAGHDRTEGVPAAGPASAPASRTAPEAPAPPKAAAERSQSGADGAAPV